MMIKRLLVVVVPAVMMSACGVSHQVSSRPVESLGLGIESSPLQFADVPVLEGFALIKDESFQFAQEAIRVGLLKYAGDLSLDEVSAFFRERMPQSGWRLVNELNHDRYILSFEKPGSTCTVTIENASVNTMVSVAIAPYSQESAKDKLLDKN